MNVLGINAYLHDSSAALIQNGRVVFAIEEERLSRVKKDARFPRLAIAAALDYGGVDPRELDAIAFGWNRPGATPLHTLRSVLAGSLPRTAKRIADPFVSGARELREGNGRRSLHRTFGALSGVPVFDIDHHEAHAWSAYALSGYDDALVIVADGRGAWQSTTIYHASAGRLRPVRVYPYPNSLGAFYEGFTDLLGFERHNDEWKVMGLAAYGEPKVPLGDAIRTTPDGYQINSRLLCGPWWNDISLLTARFGPRRNPEVRITQDDKDLAASVQRATEEALFAVVREGIRLTGSRRLCLAGGVAMNSKANGRLLASGLIEDLFVQPAATDDGTAIGAALAAHRLIGAEVPRYRLEDVYLGPGYGESEVAATLRTFKLRAIHVPDVEAVTADLLVEGNVVGWFQGRLEFGPRALGSRSILADARRIEMRDRVNESVKFREGWRPFAPSCLAEEASDYFEGCDESPFMIVTYDVHPSKRAVIPAVTHADNTARVQTVRREVNPRYWRLIKEFAARTGVPVIMNTSFNLRGEPIVCSPKDAIRTFYSSGLDFLVMGNHVLAKDPAWRPAERPESAIAR